MNYRRESNRRRKTIRLDEETDEKLRLLSDLEHCSESHYIERLIENAWDLEVLMVIFDEKTPSDHP